MSERRTLQNRELIQEVIDLCQQRASGTIFIVTDDDHLAKVALIEGEIVCADVRRKGGIEAIKALAILPSGIFGFNPDMQLVTKRQTLPDTASLIKLLQSGSLYITQAEAVAPNLEVSELPPNSKILHILTEESTEYLGPMATVICQEYLSECPANISKRDIEKVIVRLEQDIDDPDKIYNFHSIVWQRLEF